VCCGSAELELTSLKQRLEEATAVSQALRLELQLCQHLTRTTDDDDKENHQGALHFAFILLFVILYRYNIIFFHLDHRYG